MFNRAVYPEVILEDEVEELGITLTEVARLIDVHARISQIISGKRAITGDTALRFGHWFGSYAQFWFNLQTQFDRAVADQATGEEIRKLPTRATYAARPPIDQPRLV